MSKRKNTLPTNDPDRMEESESDDGQGSDLSDMEQADSDLEDMTAEEDMDVDFEFFDPRQGDFHALKRFWTQLLGPDHILLDTSGLADTVVSQPLLGTCVKTEGSESDPFATLSILNLSHRSAAGEIPVQELVQYLRSKSVGTPAIQNILSLPTAGPGPKDVGLLFSERLLNMPWQVAPPMYEMLMEEVQWAIEDGEPYAFAWYLVIGKVYREVTPTADADMPDAPLPSGKGKRQRGPIAEVFSTHAEDEIIANFAQHTMDYTFTRPSDAADSKRAFQKDGVEHSRRLYAIPSSHILQMIQALKAAGQS